MEVFAQDSFAGGIFRASEGERAPATSMHDCVNGVLDEEGAVYRRGGSAYQTTSDSPGTLLGLAVGWRQAGQFTLAWEAGRLHALNAAGTAWTELTTNAPLPFSRVATVGGFTVLSMAGTDLLLYAGSQTAVGYNAGTVTTTAGSTAVFGAGTAWLADVDPGKILIIGAEKYIIESIDSNVALTVTSPVTTAVAGSAYSIVSTNLHTPPMPAPAPATKPLASVGSPPRLLYGVHNRVYFSEAGFLTFAGTDYHEMPTNARVLGLDSFRDNAVVFTTQGVWLIQNMNLDPIDDFGNQQHTVQQVNKELVLWGEHGASGVAAWAGALVVPALDGVYVLSLNEPPVRAPELISAQISPLYRAYVEAGYSPGIATVYRGHYFLPIVNGTTWIDTLVCRLDGGAAWTRWAGHGGSATGYAVRNAHSAPQLVGIKGQRLLNLTGAFTPTGSNISDADGTSHDFTVVTRGFAGSRAHMVQWKKLRARLTATAATSVTVEPTSTYTSFDAGTAKTIDPTGAAPSTWPINKRRRMVAFRLTAPAPAGGKVALRGLELFYRQTGEQ